MGAGSLALQGARAWTTTIFTIFGPTTLRVKYSITYMAESSNHASSAFPEFFKILNLNTQKGIPLPTWCLTWCILSMCTLRTIQKSWKRTSLHAFSVYMPHEQFVFTPQPSGLEGYCRHGPGGRPGGRLPNLRNPYLCNRLMDFLHSKFCGIV